MQEIGIRTMCTRRAKVDEFKQGYYHFKEKGLYEIASFMLHQSIELTYRYLEILIQAKDIKTHSIRIHHLQLKKITSNYTCVFNEEDDNDIILLQALEDIYRSTRYENDFKIDLKVLIQLEEKMELLHINAIEIFDHSIKGFDKRIFQIQFKYHRVKFLLLNAILRNWKSQHHLRKLLNI